MLAQTLPGPRSPELASAALWIEAQETKAADITPDPTLAEATPKAAEAKADTQSDIQAAEPRQAVAEAQAPAKADTLDEELLCLALNIYHEARSEPLSGQIAVARVTLNRVASKSFPSSICGVVQQGGEKLHRCQFSWWCDGKPDHPTEPKAWRRALEISQRVLADEVSDPTHGALYYHADYVRPSWSNHYQRTSQIGRHLFYRPSRTPSAS
ncbi:MAG: cell wall hydrolase [Chromatiaceae bacterium]|nr:cell wall hydrolase [Chromatiaceae bacterium]